MLATKVSTALSMSKSLIGTHTVKCQGFDVCRYEVNFDEKWHIKMKLIEL